MMTYLRRQNVRNLFQHHFSLSLIACSLIGFPIHAASLYWDADGDPTSNDIVTGANLGGAGIWDDVLTNWFDGTSEVVWSNAADTAVFSGSNGLVTLGTNVVADSILFTNTSGSITITSVVGSLSFTLGGGVVDTGGGDHSANALIDGVENLTKRGAGMLTLGVSNNFSGKTIIDAGTLSIGADSRLGTPPGAAVADQITFNGGTLRHTASITLNANRGITLNAAGGTFERTSGNLTIAGIVSGSGSFTKTGAGTLTLSVANTMTGPINVNGGILSIGGFDRLGSGSQPVTLNGATLRNSNSSVVSIVSSSRPIIIGTNGGTLDVSTSGAIHVYNGVISGTGNTLTKIGVGEFRALQNWTFSKLLVNQGLYRLNGTGGGETGFGAIPLTVTPDAITINGGSIGTSVGVTINSNRGITLGSNGGSFVLNAVMTIPSVISGPGNLIRAAGPSPATSTLTLSGTNTYTGRTIINHSILAISKDESLGAIPSSYLSNAITIDGASAMLQTTATLTLNSNRGIYLGTNGAAISVTSGTLTYGGTVTGPGPLNKIDDSILLLSGTNDFTGGLTIYYGRIYFNNSLAAGTNTINISTNGDFGASAGAVVLTNPIVLANTSTNNTIVPANSGTVFEAAGVISGNSKLQRTDTGAGTPILSGNNTFTGGVNLKNRALRLGHRNALGTGTLTIGALPGATLGTANTPTLQSSTDLTGANAAQNAVTVNTNFAMSGSTNLELSGPMTLLASTRTVTVSGTGSRTISGVISAAAGIGLTKAGTSALTLAANNSYTGDTTVSAGTLFVNGSINTLGGSITVSNGGTLAGNGIIGGATTVYGNIAAGTNVGTLTFTNGLDLGAGTDIWELGALKDDVDGVAGVDFDSVAVTGGNVLLGGTSRISVAFTGSATAPDKTNSFWLSSHTWKVLSLSGAATNMVNTNFAGVVNGTFPAGTFNTTVDGGGNVFLHFVPNITPIVDKPFINGSDVVLTWSSLSNRTYVVEYKTNLNQIDWLTNFTVAATSAVTSVSIPLGNDFERYFRVGLLP